MNPALAPPVIEGPSAWKAGDLASDEWIHTLSGSEIEEVFGAARRAASRQDDLALLRKEDFPLPTLATRLSGILRREVLDGRGFAVIRGLDPASLDRRECAAAFLGLGAHLGNARPQNARGHILGHVKDLGRSAADPTARLYQTHERQTFHTDSCDVVALMCLQPAREGGRSSLVSSVTLHNETRSSRPDLAACLFRPIETDRRGEQGPGELPFFEIPVFNWHQGYFAAIYQRQYIESVRRLPGVPPLTDEQVEALDRLDALANDPRLHLEIDFQPGDIQLVNNHVLFHDRTAFEDWPEPERRRHLLRLWLAPPGAQPLPEVFSQRFGGVAVGDRGGISVPRETWNAPLEAE
ncbi:MAG TPA: TauD/TfdA family dioxygenase [Caulobacteraceae bacterium]|nr:TauD/TfdA family dioxygenase [Caulobacteraceae bacterium]